MKLRSAIGNILTEGYRFWRGETSLGVFSLMETLVGVILISMAVSTTDMVFWLKVFSLTVWVGSCFLWFFYILSLCLSTAFLLSRLIPKGDFKQALTMAICVYWVIPLVPIFSLLPWEKDWGLGIFATIPVFRMIPTFLVDNNYLPLGMLAVIPVILGMTGRFMAKTTGVTWWRALAMTLAAYALIYIYYYQWSQRALVAAFFHIGFTRWEAMQATFVTYSFLSQVITFLLAPVAAREYKRPLWVYLTWTGVPLVILLFIPRFGFFPLFLAAGQP
jgi:hypothetical protein